MSQCTAAAFTSKVQSISESLDSEHLHIASEQSPGKEEACNQHIDHWSDFVDVILFRVLVQIPLCQVREDQCSELPYLLDLLEH